MKKMPGTKEDLLKAISAVLQRKIPDVTDEKNSFVGFFQKLMIQKEVVVVKIK